MVSSIMDGISTALHRAFGEETRIYGDTDVLQGLEEPCFFIAPLSPSRRQVLGPRYFAAHDFAVHYFPQAPRDNAEMRAVGGRLFGALEYITLPDGGLLRGTEMRWQTVDGVLHFSVQYNAYLIAAAQEDEMERLHIGTGTMEGA